jgi:hypothetical protein
MMNAWRGTARDKAQAAKRRITEDRGAAYERKLRLWIPGGNSSDIAAA